MFDYLIETPWKLREWTVNKEGDELSQNRQWFFTLPIQGQVIFPTLNPVNAIDHEAEGKGQIEFFGF